MNISFLLHNPSCCLSPILIKASSKYFKEQTTNDQSHFLFAFPFLPSRTTGRIPQARMHHAEHDRHCGSRLIWRWMWLRRGRLQAHYRLCLHHKVSAFYFVKETFIPIHLFPSSPFPLGDLRLFSPVETWVSNTNLIKQPYIPLYMPHIYVPWITAFHSANSFPLKNIFMCVCLCAGGICTEKHESEDNRWARFSNEHSWAVECGCWGSNSCPWHEQCLLLATEPSP